MPEIDDLTVRIGADRSPLKAALAQTERDVGAWAGRLESIVARSAGRIAAELERSLAGLFHEGGVVGRTAARIVLLPKMAKSG